MGCAESTPLAELQSGGLTKEQSIDGELTSGPIAVTCVRGFGALGRQHGHRIGTSMGIGGSGGSLPSYVRDQGSRGNLKYIGARKDSEHPLPQAMEFSDAAGKKVRSCGQHQGHVGQRSHLHLRAQGLGAGVLGTHEGVPIYQVASVDRTGLGFSFNLAGGLRWRQDDAAHADVLKHGRGGKYEYLIEIYNKGTVVARGMGGLATWNNGPGRKHPATYTLECADGNDLLALLGLCFFADYILLGGGSV